VAELFINQHTPMIAMWSAQEKQGGMQVLTDYELLAGPVPAA
jgi:hypothetical protein